MSKKMFEKEEIKILSENKYVKKISNKAITYTDEFKRIFIAQYNNGKFPREIFEECGFDVDILGINRVDSCRRRWKKSYKENGAIGLVDTRKGHSGRPRIKELTLEEKYAQLEAQNNLLKAENELLKKLDMMERMMIRKK